MIHRYSTASQPITPQHPKPLFHSIPTPNSTAFLPEFSFLIGLIHPYSTASQPIVPQHANPILHSMPSRLQFLKWCVPPIFHRIPNPLLHSMPAQYSTASLPEFSFEFGLIHPYSTASQTHYSTESQPNTPQHLFPKSVFELV